MLTKSEIRSILLSCLEVGTESVEVDEDLRGAFDVSITPEGTTTSFTFTIAVRSLTRDTREAGVWVERLKIQKTGLRGVAELDALLGITLVGSQPVFVAFDTSYHIPAVGGSTNVQCAESLVLAAAADAIFHRDAKQSTGESLVSFAGHLLSAYLLGLEEVGTRSPVVLARGEAWYDSRRRVRDSGFRERVLRAYSGACALCRLGMDFPEAAHVVPHCVAADDSTANGLALCPNHHAAYDRLGVLSFTAERAAVVNRERLLVYAAQDEASVGTFLDSLREALDPVSLDQRGYLERRFELDVERSDLSAWCFPADF